MPPLRLIVERLESRLPLSVSTSVASDTAELPDLHDVFAEINAVASEENSGEFTVAAGLTDLTGPAALALSGGEQIVAYVKPGLDSHQVMARRLGASPGSEFQITTNADDDSRLAIAESSEKGYTVFWSRGTNILARQFDQNDQPVGAEHSVIQANVASNLFAICHDGGVSVIWTEEFEPGYMQLRHVTLDDAFTVVNDEVLIGSLLGSGVIVSDFDVRASPGGFSYQWIERDFRSGQPLSLNVYSWTNESGTQPIFRFPLPDSLLAVPSAILMDDGNLVVAGYRATVDSGEVFFQVADPTGDVLHDEVVAELPVTSFAFPTIAHLSNGTFAVVYYNSATLDGDLIAVQYNASYQQLTSWTVNDTPIVSPAERMLVVSNDGYSVYRSGFTLDGSPDALIQRIVQPQSSDLQVVIDAQLVPEDGYLQIQGIPYDAGLSHGNRDEVDGETWRVPIDQLGSLQILSDEFLSEYDLQISLFNADGELLADFTALVGSTDTDRLFASLDYDLVDGGGSDDDLAFSGEFSGYHGEWVTSDLALITDLGSLESLFVRNIERLIFADAEFTVEEFVELFSQVAEPDTNSLEDNSPDTPPEQGSTNTNPEDEQTVEEEVIDAPSDIDDSISPEVEPTDTEPSEEPNTAAKPEEPSSIDPPQETAPTFGTSIFETQRNQVAFAIGGMQGWFPPSPNLPGVVPPHLIGKHNLAKPHVPLAAAQQVSAAQQSEASANERKSIAAAIAGKLEDKVAAATDGIAQARPADLDSDSSADKTTAASDAPQATARLFADSRHSKTFGDRDGPDQQETPDDVPATTHTVGAPSNTSPLDHAMVMVSMIEPQMEAMSEAAAEVKAAIKNAASDHELVTGVAVVVASGISIAQAAWLLRGSVLLTKVFSSIPVWAMFDPLPILSGGSSVNPSAAHQESLSDIAQS
ncbi:MAG: hypothetical protein KDB27_30495 [Planctomycetales bacterium]|nr:hypothetical protein [Planctomycetales bacterium]